MKKFTCILLMIALMAMMLLSACGDSGNAGDTAEPEAAQTTADATAEEPSANEAETATEADTSSLDEIMGDYEMRPAEIWKTTAEVYESGDDLVLHISMEDSEYYMALAGGNVYDYSPEQQEAGTEAAYTYTFEKGVLSLTTLDGTSTMMFKKEGAE